MFHFELQILLLSILLCYCYAQYDEYLAKHKFLQLASGVYTKDPTACVKKVSPDAEILSLVKEPCGEGIGDVSNCHGFAGITHRDKAIFLVYW